jgi:acyl carrier protein
VPSADDVRPVLTDIIVSVVGCDPEDVEDQSRLKALGVDSLAVVEIADELGRRFDLYLEDETVNELHTVGDAISAVVHHAGAAAPAPVAAGFPGDAGATPTPTLRISADPERRRAMGRFAGWFAIVGAVVGIVLGLGGAALVGATGLGSTDLPPIAQPTTPTPTPTPTATATPEPEPDATAEPEPTLVISDTQVSPGQRFALEGRFPTLDRGVELQVQVRDKGEDWDDFPVTTEVRDASGQYRTEIYTSRTGERDFRVIQKDANLETPSVTVQIG